MISSRLRVFSHFSVSALYSGVQSCKTLRQYPHSLVDARIICHLTRVMDKFVTRQPRGKPEGKEQDSPTKQKVTTQHDQNRHVTRDASHRMQKSEREKFLQMPLSEKRKLYKCGKDFVTLDTVETWEDFFSENHKKLVRSKATGGKKPKVDVNEKLNKKVSLWRGDITKLEIDAIVNAANDSLLGGGGVDGAIHRAAGGKLKEECATLNGCKTGNAKITSGYKLPAKYVIHTVGPIGEKPNKLQSCYDTCLKLVKENAVRSVAFCCISTGIYGYPNENAAPLAINTVRQWLEEDGHADLVDRIIFCLFLPVDVKLYHEYMQIYFPANVPPPSEDEEKEQEDREVAENKKKSIKEVSPRKTSPDKKSAACDSQEDEEMAEPAPKKSFSETVWKKGKETSPSSMSSREKMSATCDANGEEMADPETKKSLSETVITRNKVKETSPSSVNDCKVMRVEAETTGKKQKTTDLSQSRAKQSKTDLKTETDISEPMEDEDSNQDSKSRLPSGSLSMEVAESTKL